MLAFLVAGWCQTAQEDTALCLATLAGIFLSGDLVVLTVLVDGWGLDWCLVLWMERVAGTCPGQLAAGR